MPIQTLKISPHHVKLYSNLNLPYLFLKTLFTLNNDDHNAKIIIFWGLENTQDIENTIYQCCTAFFCRRLEAYQLLSLKTSSEHNEELTAINDSESGLKAV